MTLEVQFRDVAYETLKVEDFAERLKKTYPHADCDKPCAKFDAAKACDSA